VITVINSHPYKNHSKAGQALLASIKDLPHVSLRDLYELYPDFYIDVKKEQEQLFASRLIVLQSPMHWYHVPALQSLWFEKVLSFDSSLGNHQKILMNKKVLWAVTTSSEESFFQAQEDRCFTLQQLASPLQQTFQYWGMQWLEPFVVYNSHKLSADELFQIGEKYRDRLVFELTKILPNTK
jgi:glutathione-regulated potassium-efflux system ancillary protein KefF